MLALASTKLGNGLASVAFAVITIGSLLGLYRMERLPEDRVTLRRIQLLAWVLACLMLLTLPLALESFFRMCDGAMCTTVLEHMAGDRTTLSRDATCHTTTSRVTAPM
jgi:hypothetical protein